MKYLIMLALCLLMVLPTHSQNISKEQQRVQAVINEYGDTVIQMNLSDAKIILKSVLEKEINDTLLDAYTVIDSLNKNKITLLFDKIQTLQIEKKNLTEMLANLNNIINNLKSETNMLNSVVKQQKKEIKKQKIIKTFALIGDVALPVATLLVIILAK